MKLDDFKNASASFQRLNPHVAGAVPDGPVSRSAESERKLHEQILEECKQRGWLVLHSRLDRPTTTAIGSPDFCVFADGGRVFLFECKIGSAKLRAEQRAWLAWAQRLGHKAAVIRSLDEFVELTRKLETETEDEISQ